MKPGKPLALGCIGDCAFIGLPGNPVSAMVTFLLFARPFIKNSVLAFNKLSLSAGYALTIFSSLSYASGK
jgi:molybdopterin molybdotransferase